MSEETFTESELRAAVARIKETMSSYERETPLTSANIIGSIKAHREPVWSFGDVVRDEIGVFYRVARSSNDPSQTEWHKFGYSATYPNSAPRRPLEVIFQQRSFK